MTRFVEVELPNGQVVEFPEDTPHSEMESAIKTYLGQQEEPEHQEPTLSSTAEAVAEKGFFGGAFDVARGMTYEPLVGMLGATPQFMEATGRKAFAQGKAALAGEDIAAPETKARIEQEAQPALGAYLQPSSATGKLALHGLEKLFTMGTQHAAESVVGMEQLRRTIISQIPMLQDLPGQQPLSEMEAANLVEGTKTGIEAGMVAGLARGAYKGTKGAYDRLQTMRKGEESLPTPDVKKDYDPVTAVREATGEAKVREIDGQPYDPKAPLDLPLESGPTPIDMKIQTGKGKPPKSVGEPRPARVDILLEDGTRAPVDILLPDAATAIETIQRIDMGRSNQRPVEKPFDSETRKKFLSSIYDGILKNDISQVLASLKQSDSAIYRAVASKMETLEQFKPNLILTDKKLEGAGEWGTAQAFYSPTLDTVAIRATGRELPVDHAIVHELTHAAVAHLQLDIMRGRNTFVTEAAINAHQKLNKLLDIVDSEFALDAMFNKKLPVYADYAVKNILEFIAEAFSNRQLQTWMAKTKLPGEPRTYWDVFRDAIADTLGLSKKTDTTILDAVLENGYKLLEEAIPARTRASAAERSRGLAEVEKQRLEAPRSDKTQFELEEELPKGGGASVADLTAPLERRAVETLNKGKDLAQGTKQEFFEKLPNDIGSFFTKYILNPEHLSKLISDKNPLLKAYTDRILWTKRKWANTIETIQQGALISGQALTGKIPGITTYLSYIKRSGYGFRGIVERLDPAKQQQFFRTRMEWENHPILKEQGLQWPTREMLKEKGASPEVVEAYMLETKYMDSAYEAINWARQLLGKEPVSRIPGYFPHSYKGHMAVRILGRDADGTTYTAGFAKGSGNRAKLNQVARDLIAEVQKELGPEVTLEPVIYRIDKPGGTVDLVESMQHTADAYANAHKPVGKLVHKMLNKRLESMEQAFLGHQMKRHGVVGWVGSFGKVTMKDLMEARERYMEDAFKFAESTDIQVNVINQISPKTYETLRKKMPNTADFMFRFGEVAREKFPLNAIDKAFLNIFSDVTKERFSYRAPLMGLHKLRSFFAMKDLAWSVSYHSGNLVQPEMIGSIALMREYNRIGKGNPGLAMAMAEKEVYFPRLENKKALEWAAENKVISPKLMQEIDILVTREAQHATKLQKLGAVGKEALTGRWASELNEAYGRARTFISGLEYYRSAGFKEIQARRAAAKFADDVMVDYSSTGQPLWLSSNPGGQIISRIIAPYAAFRHSFWGQTALSIQAIKNNPGMRRKLLPLLQLQMATALFSGMRGMAFIAEIQLVTNLINTWWESTFQEEGPLVNPEKLMLESGTGDFAMFGMLSASTKLIPGVSEGIDVGTTTAAPEITEAVTPRSLEGSGGILQATSVLFKSLLSDAPTSEIIQAWQNVLPGWLGGQVEVWFHPEGSLAEVSRDPRARQRGGVERNRADWTARAFGKRSLTEQRQLMVGREIQKELQRATNRKSDLVEIGADQLEERGYIQPELYDKAYDEGWTFLDYNDRIETMLEERRNSRIRRWYNPEEPSKTREKIRDIVDNALESSNYFGLY